MSHTQPTIALSCYCGNATLELSAPPQAPINCHCGQCRRLSGSAFTTWVTTRRAALTVNAVDAIAEYQVTSNVNRFFCKKCGTHVYTEDARLPTAYGLPAGLFKPDDLLTPRADYFVSDKATWYTAPLAGPCFGGPTGMAPINAVVAQ